MNKKIDLQELNVFSGIAILFVLCIHACASGLQNLCVDAISYSETQFSVRAISNIVAPAVPIFIFLSGYKFALHSTDEAYFHFLKKRLPRVLMSFFIINTFFWAVDCTLWMDEFDLLLLAKSYAMSWLGYSVAYPLWYIPMYCFTIILCPLVYKVIRPSKYRLLLYFTIGITQRIMALYIPTIESYPVMFVAYPLFFEMGLVFCQKEIKVKTSKRCWSIVAYIFIVLICSYKWPSLSTNLVFKYIIYYVIGTIIFFFFSQNIHNSKLLSYFGKKSYPIFLLHEPLIGRCVSKILLQLEIENPLLYILLWVIVVLSVTLILIRLLELIKIDKILWKFSLR